MEFCVGIADLNELSIGNIGRIEGTNRNDVRKSVLVLPYHLGEKRHDLRYCVGSRDLQMTHDTTSIESDQ